MFLEADPVPLCPDLRELKITDPVLQPMDVDVSDFLGGQVISVIESLGLDIRKFFLDRMDFRIDLPVAFGDVGHEVVHARSIHP